MQKNKKTEKTERIVLQDRVETKMQQSNTGQHIQRKQAEKQEHKIHKVKVKIINK